MKKRAIISVSDKKGIVNFAQKLIELGFEIIATGGTERILKVHKVEVTPVEDITHFPECLDGRVKTLDPHIFAGILARDTAEHNQTMSQLHLGQIDLVVVNLYPFRNTILNETNTLYQCIENIDIGGPSMLRAAAKNHERVTVITYPEDYDAVLAELVETGETSMATRKRLALRVFEHTAAYDATIAQYFAQCDFMGNSVAKPYYPAEMTLTYRLQSRLRYGENSHQDAAFYGTVIPQKYELINAKQLQGKELSYNNINDTNAALRLSLEFDEPAVVAIKHANPCGVAVASNMNTAWQKAYEADPVSIYGGIVAINREVDAELAQKMSAIFLEVVIAPAFTDEALAIFGKKKNLRLLVLAELGRSVESVKSTVQVKSVSGGVLLQTDDTVLYEQINVSVATNAQPDEAMLADMRFAMTVVKHVKSNAIVLVKNGQTVGIGPGQPNRVTSCRIAIKNAGEKALGSILASDAYIPFRDTVDVAVEAGVAGIIQPGGSIHDNEAIMAANEANIPMVMTQIRHFCH